MKKILGLFISVFALISTYTESCTGITIKTGDSIVQARTIEYGEGNLNSKIVISPRGQKYKSFTPTGKVDGYEWTGKYGFVGASLIHDSFIGEGVNEKGLNAGLFYFPHYGSLAPFSKEKEELSKSLSDLQVVSWLLSNFETVDEVKEGLKTVKIVNIGYQQDGTPLPTAHWRVADRNGNNIVIEIENNGEINIHENKVGVLTNSPDYQWHIKNLNNYINLYSGNAKSYEVNGQEIFSFGAGTGALGLPGDVTPPSRFVRAFFYLNSLPPVETNGERVNQAFHILNNFDIPIGVEYPKEHFDKIPKDLPSATQWTAVSDLNNLEFYYKTMYNSQIRKIDLKKIDFSKVKYQVLPMDEKPQESILEINVK